MRLSFAVPILGLLLASCDTTISETAASRSSSDGYTIFAKSEFTGSEIFDSTVRLDPNTIFGLSGVSQFATIPIRLELGLDQSPGSNAVRAKGLPVYAYVKQIYVARKVDNKDQTSSIIDGRIQLPGDNICDGYKLVLSPSNDYSVVESFSWRFKFRDQSDGLNAGILGQHGVEDWVIDDIETSAFVVRSGGSAFSIDTGRSLYQPCLYKKTRSQWLQ